MKAAEKIDEQKKAAKEKAKEVEKKLEVQAKKEEKVAFDKVLANKKAEVLGIPVLETPKPEVKPLMTSDQAIKMVKQEKKEVAEVKLIKDNEEAKMKSLENVGEKKDKDSEVPVSKCPSEIKKEKEVAEKAEEEVKAKAVSADLVAKQEEKQKAYEAKVAVEEKATEKEKKANEAAATLKDNLEGQ